MIPPEFESVIDRHGGFTIESQMPSYMKRHTVFGKTLKRLGRFDMVGRRESLTRALKGAQPARELPIGQTLWRPGALLKGDTVGRLLAFDEESFYQQNNDVTVALYRVPGYGYPIILWFDNKTGERIA
jgi:hypothetical protein